MTHEKRSKTYLKHLGDYELNKTLTCVVLSTPLLRNVIFYKINIWFGLLTIPTIILSNYTFVHHIIKSGWYMNIYETNVKEKSY